MDNAEKQRLLYDAGINFIVSKKTEGDAWEKECLYMEHMKGASKAAVEEAFNATEHELKTTMGIKSMPTPWRTAKSYALRAHEKGVALVAPSGLPYGKTAISKALKEDVPITHYLRVVSAFRTINKLLPMLTTKELGSVASNKDVKDIIKLTYYLVGEIDTVAARVGGIQNAGTQTMQYVIICRPAGNPCSSGRDRRVGIAAN